MMRRRTLMLILITVSIVCSTGFLASVIIQKFSQMRQEDLALRQSTAWAQASSELPKPLVFPSKLKKKPEQESVFAAAPPFGPTRRTLWRNGTVCSKPVCDRQENYLRGKLDETQEPCEDFYSFVCSAKWVTKGTKVDNAPYQAQTTAKVMYELQRMFHQYFRARQQTYYDYPGTFISQALFFVPNCTSIYSRNGLGWDPWQELLGKFGLEGWPFTHLSEKNVSAIAGMVDGTMGVFPYTEVRVLNEYDSKYVVQLDTPQTILRRHQLWYTNENLFNYTQLVARAFSILGVIQDVDVLAENVAILEIRLEDAISLKKFAPPLARVRTLEEIPRSHKWSWKDYINVIFRFPLNVITRVELLSPDYYRDLAVIMDNTSYTTLVNYLGFRTMVYLSPMLPDEVEFLVPLSHAHPVVGIGERFQACTHLLEQLFPYGMRTFLRMTLGDDNPLRYSTKLDTQMLSLFNITQQLVAGLVANAYWFNPVERIIAKEKVLNLAFDFMGTITDLSVPAVYYDSKAPPFDGSKLLQSFFAIQSNNKKIYYDPWHRPMDFDNQHYISSMVPGLEYLYGRNSLFIPYAVVAFLKGLSRTIEPLFTPMVAQYVLKGLFQTIGERGSYIDHRSRTKEWWSRETNKKYFFLKDCLFKQYKAEMEAISPEVDVITDIDSNMADNGVMVPLYDLYLKVLGMDSVKARRTRAPFGRFTVEQLFFIYYAIGRCDQRGLEHAKRQVGFGETPARIKVNIPLRNFARFSEAFGCQRGNEMSPLDRCLIW